jgi:hypothetical protein
MVAREAKADADRAAYSALKTGARPLLKATLRGALLRRRFQRSFGGNAQSSSMIREIKNHYLI